MLRLKLDGFDRVVRKLDVMGSTSRSQVGSGTRLLADSILADARVPIKTGALAGSGVATGPDESGASEVTFGGAAAPYALAVHEIADASHDTGESRYLTRASERAEASGTPTRALRKVATDVIRKGQSA